MTSTIFKKVIVLSYQSRLRYSYKMRFYHSY